MGHRWRGRPPEATTVTDQPLLTRTQVAKLLSMSLRSVDRLVARGILPAVKLLSTVRFRPEDVQALVQRGSARPAG